MTWDDGSTSLYAHITGKVEPLKTRLCGVESITAEELKVFICTIGNQYILECFTLPQDFFRGIDVVRLVLIVEVDEITIHIRTVGEDLLHADEHAAIDHAMIDPPHQAVAPQGPDELKGPANCHNTGVAQIHAGEVFIEVCAAELYLMAQ